MRPGKLSEIRAMGLDPYPPRPGARTWPWMRSLPSRSGKLPSRRTGRAAGSERRACRGPQSEGPSVTSSGRLRLRRAGGKATFAHIEDESGRVQLYFRINDLQEPPWDYEAVNRLLDLGDFMQARRLHVPHPHGRSDPARSKLPPFLQGSTPAARQVPWPFRYRDALSPALPGPDRQRRIARVFRSLARVVSSIRAFLDARGFLEVETPVLQPLYGGATARPSSPTTTLSTRTSTCASPTSFTSRG